MVINVQSHQFEDAMHFFLILSNWWKSSGHRFGLISLMGQQIIQFDGPQWLAIRWPNVTSNKISGSRNLLLLFISTRHQCDDDLPLSNDRIPMFVTCSNDFFVFFSHDFMTMSVKKHLPALCYWKLIITTSFQAFSGRLLSRLSQHWI